MKVFPVASAPLHRERGREGCQLLVIARMATDLALPTRVIPCSTVREADGLALSSRNVLLSAEERAAAPVLHGALRAAQDAYARGERTIYGHDLPEQHGHSRGGKPGDAQ